MACDVRLSPPVVVPGLKQQGDGSEEVGKVIAPPGCDWPENDWWGNSWGANAVSIRAFGLILAEVDESASDHIARTDGMIDEWATLLHDWLSALAGVPIEVISSFTAEVTWQGQRYGNIESYIGRSIRVNDPKPVTAEQWQYAFSRAGEGEEPPIARVLLVNALSALSAQSWRAAVVDAATAAEVALAAGMRDKVQGEASEAVADALLGRMLGQMVELARDLRLEVPAQITDDLVKPRKIVLHRGGRATEDEAKRACLVAADVVGKYVSLPSDAPQ